MAIILMGIAAFHTINDSLKAGEIATGHFVTLAMTIGRQWQFKGQ
jgi:hypothetical protein